MACARRVIFRFVKGTPFATKASRCLWSRCCWCCSLYICCQDVSMLPKQHKGLMTRREQVALTSAIVERAALELPSRSWGPWQVLWLVICWCAHVLFVTVCCARALNVKCIGVMLQNRCYHVNEVSPGRWHTNTIVKFNCYACDWVEHNELPWYHQWEVMVCFYCRVTWARPTSRRKRFLAWASAR